MLLTRLLTSWAIILVTAAATDTCSSTRRCEIGCCNKFGNCGFGPDFCSGGTCVFDCERKSECDPGFGSKWSNRDKCPLNACCSKDGLCGTTEEFCGGKKVRYEKCSSTYGTSRVVGYFEGWAQNRRCNIVWPEDIPLGVYTHINFAYASIDPQTYRVVPASERDLNLYERVTLLKERELDLSIYISIGGWTFNDPGPTETVFSNLVASVTRQTAFIESLISFVATYGFDGVDINWEYPVTEDRFGRAEDYANFPNFMRRLKTAMKGLGKGVTITLPAAYRHLQHFDIVELAETVDWFNMKTYDLRGTWHRGNKWTGDFLNAHTNLTDVDQALDLLWRNEVHPTQVVLGLSFYGRSFTLTSPSCTEPGCTFESGGDRGPCTREVGVLLNSEIDQLVEKNGVEPKLYQEAAVKVATWGDQWVAYDDEETLAIKSSYAQSMRLSGLMVWAISHDTKDGKYTKALSRVTNTNRPPGRVTYDAAKP